MSGAGDLVFGAGVLVIFLAVIAVVGVALYRFKNARFARVWSPLVPLVDGTVRGDGGGAARSELHGRYGGRSVVAAMSPHAGDRGRTGSATTGFAANLFEVVLTDVGGRTDWQLLFAGGSWELRTADEGLRARLEAGDLVARVTALGWPSPAITAVGLPVLAYTARNRDLHLREDAGSAWVPSPERFRTELDALLGLAELNERLNG